VSTGEQRALGAKRSNHDRSPGQPFDVRQIGKGDREELDGLLLTLDEMSRLCRFNQPAIDAYLRAHVEYALSTSTWIGGVFIGDHLRGVVEVYDYGTAGFAEAAFVVDPDWRCRGIGFALLRAAMEWGRRSNVPMLRMMFSRGNLPMRKLAAKAEARFELAFDEMTADVVLGERYQQTALRLASGS
jgi:GNAT superfamily N-acetyltransferase